VSPRTGTPAIDLPAGAEPLADELGSSMAAALRGNEGAARAYARAWRRLVRLVLAVEAPEAPAAAADVLDHLALTAPFSPWVEAHGTARGLVLAAMSETRGIVPGMEPLPVPLVSASGPFPDGLGYQRFSRVVLQELSGAGTGLERLMAAWRLSTTDVARLFGVRRQAVQQWLDEGVPPAREPKLTTILRVADLLERNLMAERIPAVVRSPAPAYGGSTLLDLIGDDRHEALLETTAESFDWSLSA
jgi:hypothetical protein